MIKSVSEKVEKIQYKFSHIRNQLIVVLWVNLIAAAHGLITGWLSPAILLLQSYETPLHNGPLSVEEVSWLGSIINIGNIVGNLSFTIINRFFGRKIGLVFLGFPNMICWIIIMFARDIELLYLARFLAGCTGGGTLICIPLFIADISSSHIRGTFGFYFVLIFNMGAFVGYILCSYVPYHISPFILVLLPILYFLGIVWIPNTPQFLLEKGKTEEAEKALRFYINCYDESTPSEKGRFRAEYDDILNFEHKKKSETLKISLSDITNPEARRGLFIASCLIFLNILSGSFMLNYYSGTTFKESGSTLDPTMSSIIVMVVQLVGTYTASILIDRCGRRILLMLSSTGAAIGLSVMGTFSYLSQCGYNLEAFNLVPIISFSVSSYCFAIGLIPLCYVIIAEVLPSKIRLFGSTYSMLLLSLLFFITTKYVPIVVYGFGLHYCFFFFTIVCIFGIFFAIFILPETKGKNLNN